MVEISEEDLVCLIQQAKSGDTDSFDQLIEYFRPILCRVVAQQALGFLTPGADASDVVQETLIATY